MNIPSDEIELLKRWRSASDAHAFREIVRRHAAMVYATCRRILRSSEDAEDVSQECFLQLAAAPSNIASIGGWLHTVAVRRAKNLQRTAERRKMREEIATRDLTESGGNSDTRWQDLEPLVDECIEQLPAELRDAVVAYFLEQRSQAEVAASLGISQSTMSRRIDAGLNAIHDALSKRGISVSTAALSILLPAASSEAVPATMIAALGKVAVSGSGTALPAAATTFMGVLIVMKKGLLLVATAVAVALFAWWQINERSPDYNAKGEPVTVVRRTSSTAPAGQSETGAMSDASVIATTSGTATAGRGQLPVADDAERSSDVRVPDEAAAGTSAIEGRVLWRSDRKPAGNQLVSVWSQSKDLSQQANTNERGEFSFAGLPAATYMVTVHDSRVQPQQKPLPVVLSDDQKKTGILLYISAGGRIEGTVYSGKTALEDRELSFNQWGAGAENGRQKIRTDADGHYVVEGVLEGERSFQAWIDGGDEARLSSDIVRTQIAEGQTATVDFHFMAGSATLEGNVFVNGQPAVKERILLYIYDRGGTVLGTVADLATEDDGSFWIENVEAGRITVHGALAPSGRPPIFTDPLPITTRAGAISKIDLSFKRGSGILTGHITRGKQPVREGSMILFGRIVPTDVEGAYRVDDVPEGTATFAPTLVTPAGKISPVEAAEIEIVANQIAIADFDFPAGTASLEGRLYTDGDQPVKATIVIRCVGTAGDENEYFVSPKDDGTYLAEGLPAGTAIVQLMLSNDAFVPRIEIPLILTDNELTTQDIYVEKELLDSIPK